MSKQIKEMAEALLEAVNEKHGHISMRGLAEALYNAGFRKQNEWIPVTERLPERFTHIIVCDENGTVGEAYHFEGGRFEWLADEELAFATHWMPLPELPEAEKGGVE